ncbi:MAG TPA: BolA family protein [Bdellovibrionota bacterium]|nr:BolA family protein [Bdellovibrionota bacterium]
MNIDQMKKAIQEQLSPTHLELADESVQHLGHSQASGGGHFRLLVVSTQFEGKSLVDRHRMVYDAVNMGNNPAIHALAIRAYTPEEWKKP